MPNESATSSNAFETTASSWGDDGVSYGDYGEIVENLRAALEQFESVWKGLAGSRSRPLTA